jgi:DHA3 family macrolide efflux protein-like MFS transporter
MGGAVLFTAVFGRIATTGVGMLSIGFGAAFVVVTSQTLFQHETPKDLLGRVTSSMMSLMAFSQVIAMLLAVPLAEQGGIRTLYFRSAAMLLCIGAIGHSKLKGLAAAA